jgi:hypothetical protein
MPRAFLTWLLLVLALGPRAAAAADFRVETKVYEADSREPASENTTLFAAGKVYDYLADGSSVAIFDPARTRFVLLDVERRLRIEIVQGQVEAFVRELRARAAAGSSFLKFAAHPQFEIEHQADQNTLHLHHKLMRYELATIQPALPEAAQAYREFCDAYGQLNAMLQPGSLPPFPRQTVNHELARRDLVPTAVHLTIPPRTPLFGQGLTRRSEHHFTWRLVDEDLKRIAQTDRQLVTFTAVTLEEYLRRQAPGRVARAAMAR